MSDEVGLASDRRSFAKSVRREEMGVSGVVNIGCVDELGNGSDPSEPSRICLGDNARDKVIVTRTPDEMRPERNDRQVRTIRA